jgi:NAD(P)-dependent dehydrogenase (short-subunit alcohol dehydrogenase family)
MQLMNDLFDLTGKTAIVTGSSRGIGLAIAQALADRGANVVISSRKQEACDAAAEQINARGRGKAAAIAASISDKAALQALVDATNETFGQIDILVCNAATNPHFGPIMTIEDEQFEKILRNNILANHWLVQMVSPGMRERKNGSIIIVSSVGGYRGSVGIGAYNVSKAADFQLARNYAVEFGRDQVRVNCITPGIVRTDFARAIWADEANHAKAVGDIPLGRIGEPEDIAGAAVFLASDAGRYMTGQSMIIDGGVTTTLSGV